MKRLSLSILSLGLALCLMAQAPERVKYQSVVRDGTGAIIVSAPVSFRISVLEGSTSGPSAYTETHSAATNEFGLVNLEIGGGTPVSGDFATIDWGANSYFFKLELDATGGTNYQVMGTSKALSVPYALYAATSASQLPGPQGPQGPPGTQGAAGAAGPAGPTGATGPQGPAGEDGTGVTILGSFANESELPSTGDPGDSYLIGGDLYVWSATANDWENVGTIQGPAGATGAAGPAGPPGATGPEGPAGPAGATGPQGLPGAQGPAGAIGATGPAGPTGPQGTPGATGPQGIPGATGPQGPAGTPGAAGATGPQGPAGEDGSGVNILGSFANENQLPVTGAPGDAYLINGDLWVWSDNSNDWENVGNIQGPAGPAGATGAAGPAGPQGTPGTTGATGPQGPAGPQGTAGAAGATGPAGPAGTPGATGPAGPQGPTGPAGSANINGTLNKLVKFTGATTGGNSNVSDDGTNVTVDIPTNPGQFQVNTGVATFTMVNQPNLGGDIRVAEFAAVQRNPWISFKRSLLDGSDPFLWCQGMDSDGAYFLGTGGGPVLGERAWTTLQNGNFGIGTTAPAYALSVESDEEGHAMSVRNANDAGSSSITFAGADGIEKASIGFGNPGYNSPFSGLTYINSGPALALGTQGGERVRITEGGAVGIGTSTPAATLDVIGAVKVTDGTEGVGKTLTSDANGLATWQRSCANAYGLIGVEGAYGAYGIASVEHPSVGNWNVILTNPFPSNGTAVCTIWDTNAYGFISYYDSDYNVIQVKVRDAAGEPADMSFCIAVFGN